MLNKIQIESKVEGGKLKRNRSLLSDSIRSFEGKNIVITIERKTNKRTNAQNSWYWSVAVELIRQRLNEYGYRYSKDQTHEKLKLWIADFAPEIMLEETVIQSTGQILASVKSTSELTTSDFMAYKEAIQEWCVETLDLNIPDPDEQLKIEHY